MANYNDITTTYKAELLSFCNDAVRIRKNRVDVQQIDNEEQRISMT